jgi:hypothetical protein
MSLNLEPRYAQANFEETLGSRPDVGLRKWVLGYLVGSLIAVALLCYMFSFLVYMSAWYSILPYSFIFFNYILYLGLWLFICLTLARLSRSLRTSLDHVSINK